MESSLVDGETKPNRNATKQTHPGQIAELALTLQPAVIDELCGKGFAEF